MIAPSGLALLLEQSASPAGSASLRALRTAWRAEPGLRDAWGDAAPQGRVGVVLSIHLRWASSFAPDLSHAVNISSGAMMKI